MEDYKEYLRCDLVRQKGKWPNLYVKNFYTYLRKAQFARSKIARYYYKFRYLRLARKHGIEIYPELNAGKGLLLLHAFNITVNSKSVIGENVTISKGVTIGQENRGKRKGCPVIGNKVWIGVNAAIVGKITIGDDVLIAPNAYVNCDVPSHSVVFGNPCVIKHRDDATEAYAVSCFE